MAVSNTLLGATKLAKTLFDSPSDDPLSDFIVQWKAGKHEEYDAYFIIDLVREFTALASR